MVNPTEYLPKSYHPRVSTYWWLARWPYLKFILREPSSVFVAWFVVVTLLQIRALTRGPADYAAFQQWLRSPLLLTMNAVSFLFVMFHAVTWFNLAPKAMAVRVAWKAASCRWLSRRRTTSPGCDIRRHCLDPSARVNEQRDRTNRFFGCFSVPAASSPRC